MQMAGVKQQSHRTSAHQHVPIKYLCSDFVWENQDLRVDHGQLVFRVRQLPQQFLQPSSPFLADGRNAYLLLGMLRGGSLTVVSWFLRRGIYVRLNLGGNAGSFRILSIKFAGDGPLKQFDSLEQGSDIFLLAKRIHWVQIGDRE